MSDLTQLTLAQARQKLVSKNISSVELTEAFLERLVAHRHLNAYITENTDKALQQAQESDKKLSQGTARKLEGLPLAIKDLFCTQGLRTTAGSKILGNFVPPYESTVTQNLWDEGAVCLGKTNMDEFAMGSANLTSFFGPVESPWRSKAHPEKTLVPGGSSGGSASAVAARLCLAATASDTGGSIRQPAAFCGLVGIKPTYGLCSRWGMVAFASSLDQAGPLTHTVEDAALMLSVMASYDEKDATSSSQQVRNYDHNLSDNIKGLRIGLPKEYLENLTPETLAMVQNGIQWLKDAGAQIVEGVSLPLTQYALPVYYIIAPAEASSNLARYDGVRYGFRADHVNKLEELYERSRGEGFGQEVRRRILIGTYVLSSGYYDAYYVQAQKIRSLIQADFRRIFETVDVLLTPTTPNAAFPLNEPPKDPVTMYLNDIYTVTVNLAGLPAISVPAGYDKEGLPLGLQIIGSNFQEQRILNTAYAIEQRSGFKGL